MRWIFRAIGAGPVARKVRYVLLCRHASHQGGVLRLDEKTKRYPTQDVADRLREELLFGRQVNVKRLLYAPTPEARRTAWLLQRELSATATPRPPGELAGTGEFTICPPDWATDVCIGKQVVHYAECQALSPDQPRSSATAATGVDAVTEGLRGLPAGGGVLVVGHMPQLSWLAYRLTRGFGGRWWKPWERAALPLASGEVVCLAVTEWGGRWSGHLRWAITPTDEEALKSLYEKIKGKMESAKQLAAVITLLLGGLLGVLLDTSKWSGLGQVKTGFPAPFDYSGQGAVQTAFGLLLAALALYLMTMYSYDRLLMPTRFWAELPPRRGDQPRGVKWLPRRPPSSSAWVVYRNMMRTWYTLFTAATALVAMAVAVLGAALLRLDARDLGWAVLAVAALIAVRWLFRPVLGSED
jgi:hypothetical protein